MKKTLQEIQFFNRRKIFKAINGTEVCFSHIQALELLTKPLTLDRVLLALEPYPNNFGIVAGNIARIDRKNHTYNFICPWGLTKSTLEEQSEETQRAIYEFLGGENEELPEPTTLEQVKKEYPDNVFKYQQIYIK